MIIHYPKEHNISISIVNHYTPQVTHLITRVLVEEGSIMKSRSIKYFHALLNGIYIMTFNWLLESYLLTQETGLLTLLSEDTFIVNGDPYTLGGAERARKILRAKNSAGDRLFENLYFILHHPNQSNSWTYSNNNNKIDLNDIKELIYNGGGHIIDINQISKISATKRVCILFNLYQQKIQWQQQHQKNLQINIRLGTLQWFFDCISSYQLLDITAYDMEKNN